MSDEPIDVRTPLASSENVRVDAGPDGVLHLHVGPLTLHLHRDRCEELTTTLARAMVGLARAERAAKAPKLRLVRPGSDVPGADPGQPS
jgi:hypothetical protein